MLNFLLDHAIRNVWCSPYQDDQAILKLTRITSVDRAVNYIDYQYTRFVLPTLKEDYHVYVIGANQQDRLNLTDKIGVWEDFATMAVRYNLVADLYTLSGLQLSSKRCYVQRGPKGNYIVAIKMHDRVVNLDTNAVYLRLYRNAYYGSKQDTSGAEDVRYGGGQILTADEALVYQREYLSYKQYSEGHAYAFLNGYLVDDFKPNEVAKGDIIEWVYDSSISEVVDLKVDKLPAFTSDMDEMHKYILHLPKKLDMINYHDDIDFYLIRKRPEAPTRYKGVYYNKNSIKSVRMLTHRDYSIPTQYIQDLITGQPGWEDISNLYIRCHIRKSGYDRPLVDEANRIKELYKLKDAEIIRAMAGSDATVPEWQVNTLERAGYTRIMRSFFWDITPEEVMHAYGYNAMTKLIADTPNKVANGFVDVPIAHQKNSTAYEFDANGYLTGWRVHPGGNVYYPMSATTQLVEFIDGIGGESAGIKYSTDAVVLNPDVGYRFYVSRINTAGEVQNKWIDVTGDNNFYTVDNTKKVVWHLDPRMYLGIVKSDTHFTSLNFSIPEYNHMYKFNLTHNQVPGALLYLEPARLDIWMNKRALIEHIDYHVEFPEVVIYNKEFLVDGNQEFVVRGYGFANPDMTRDLSAQRGYVIHGMVSVNNTYDVRDDKVIRVVVNGRTFHRDSIKFSEDRRNVVLPGIVNGRPYLIQDAVAPIRGLVQYDTHPLRDQSIETDRHVSDYLTMKLPEKLPTDPSAIPNRYWTYSPFLARVLYDLWAEFIPALDPSDTEENVDKLMQPYLWLLNFDPCRRDYVDLRYTNIHAHPKKSVLGITRYQYVFLERLNILYLNGRVDLTPFLEIISEGVPGEVFQERS